MPTGLPSHRASRHQPDCKWHQQLDPACGYFSVHALILPPIRHICLITPGINTDPGLRPNRSPSSSIARNCHDNSPLWPATLGQMHCGHDSCVPSTHGFPGKHPPADPPWNTFCTIIFTRIPLILLIYVIYCTFLVEFLLAMYSFCIIIFVHAGKRCSRFVCTCINSFSQLIQQDLLEDEE